jgi:hypothetical protein
VLARIGVVVLTALALGASAGARQLADTWTVNLTTPGTATVNTEFTVTASVTYTYPTNNNITLTVQLPGNATVVSYDDHAHCSDPTFSKTSSCTFPLLSGTATVNYTLRAAPAAPGDGMTMIASSANGFATPSPPPGVSTGTTVLAPPPSITISAATSASQAVAGTPDSFTVTVTNTGSFATANVWVEFDQGFHWTGDSMVQAGGPAFSCSNDQCFAASFPGGSTATFTARATPASDVTPGQILDTRYMVYLGPSPGGSAYASTSASLQVAAPATTTTTPTTTVSRPPSTTTTTTTTTTTPASVPATTTTTATPQPQRCHVPNVGGSTLARAKTLAKERACRVSATYAHSTKARRGRIVRQSPAAGKWLAHLGMVHVVVSRGPG